jgi:hypothetical protein
MMIIKDCTMFSRRTRSRKAPPWVAFTRRKTHLLEQLLDSSLLHYIFNRILDAGTATKTQDSVLIDYF